MRFLALGPKEIAQLHQVKEHAMANRFGLRQLLRIHKGEEPSAGDREGYRCVLPVNMEVVFSIEQHLDLNWYRHCSVSAGKSIPPPPILHAIAKEFGFTGTFGGDSMNLWIEDHPDGTHAANVVQRMD